MILANQMRELSSYPILEMVKVKAEDVDDVIYCDENIGASLKTIIYKNTNGGISKKEFFTYNIDFNGYETDVKKIYSTKFTNCLGLWTDSSAPTEKAENLFYYVPIFIEINGQEYEEENVIGCVNTGNKLEWRKCLLDNKGIPKEV